MATSTIVGLIIGAVVALGAAGAITYHGVTTDSARNKAEQAQEDLDRYANFARKPGIAEEKELEAYLRDAVNLGVLDPETHKDVLAVFTKLKNNNYNYKELNKKESQKIIDLYNELSANDATFQSLWNQQMSEIDIEEQLKIAQGLSNLKLKDIPKPQFLDTDVSTYQKPVEDVRHLTNKEVADLMNLDYDFEHIKNDIDRAAEAEVKYGNWQSNLLANNEERNNALEFADYLNSIKNTKAEAIQKGATNGARAAAELLDNINAISNKSVSESETAQNRFKAVDQALLNRASTELNTLSDYTALAQALGTTGNDYYDADVDRIGQDWWSNAIYRNADERLRANNIATNNVLSGIYNATAAQNQGYVDAANAPYNYFRDITLPANDYDVIRAYSDYIDLATKQQTGYEDVMSKFGGMSKNANK